MSAPRAIHLSEKLASFSDHWNPRIVGRYNDSELRVVKLSGEFSWHAHDATDELFLVIQGVMHIDFRDGSQRLQQGDAIIVPSGVEHRPRADAECHVLLMDRAGEPNTGNTPSALTAGDLEAI
jgi:mannose-6-phosphate isomerase-like protein (cupin superfamily)|tara:strand:- start:32758 stop:33126 length:369 start_codon:yes stop_codon:yes gene_type:complete